MRLQQMDVQTILSKRCRHAPMQAHRGFARRATRRAESRRHVLLRRNESAGTAS